MDEEQDKTIAVAIIEMTKEEIEAQKDSKSTFIDCIPKPKFSDAAVEWVGTNMSYDIYEQDWVAAGCQTFDAGREFFAAEVRNFLEDGYEDGCNCCANIAEFLLRVKDDR